MTGPCDDLQRCRARIAAEWTSAWPPGRLGNIVLRPGQREAVARIAVLLDRHRGCLLADDVGRGKTFTALATARRWLRPLVVAPAALRDTWRIAMQRAGVECAFITHEALSRAGEPAVVPDGVIVDESHHFRNAGTQRHASLARLAGRAELLLLSATPVQNSLADLASQLMLCLGSAAAALDERLLTAFVVRVETDEVDDGLPRLDPPVWLSVAADDATVLEAILDLPAPPRALDAGDAGALRTISLVRAWASSRAALAAALARRRRTALAAEQSLDAGRLPTRAELRSWHTAGDDVLQLGFAALLAAHELGDREGGRRAALREAIDREQAALARLAVLLRERAGVDLARADALARVVHAHAGQRVIAFTSFARTARVYYELLRHRPGVGLLTAAGASIASGPITRRELMARFAPAAHGWAESPPHERVMLLVTTDLLSEGVNLQDASVVVHLDLPWNPARLAQRVGRVRRPHGSARVHAYLLAPPAGTERVLQVEARLRRKLRAAERAIGRSVDVVPSLTLSGSAVDGTDTAGAAAVSGVAACRAAIDRQLREWRDLAGGLPSGSEPLAGAVCSEHRGWLALLAHGRLVAALDGEVGDDVDLLARATAAAAGVARAVPDAELRSARCALRAFLQREHLMMDCGVRTLVSPIARPTLREAARRLGPLSRHERPRALPLVAELRAALARPCPLGAERALMRLLDDRSGLNVVAWLERAVACLPVGSPRALHADVDEVPAALLILGASAID